MPGQSKPSLMVAILNYQSLGSAAKLEHALFPPYQANPNQDLSS